MPASLLDLPPEVVALVIERLTTIPSWGTTVRLCKQTKQLCRSPKVYRHLVNLMVRPEGGQRFRFSSPTSTEVVVDHDLPDTGDAILTAADCSPQELLPQLWPHLNPACIKITRMAASIFRLSSSSVAVVRSSLQLAKDKYRDEQHPLLLRGGAESLIERTMKLVTAHSVLQVHLPIVVKWTSNQEQWSDDLGEAARYCARITWHTRVPPAMSWCVRFLTPHEPPTLACERELHACPPPARALCSPSTLRAAVHVPRQVYVRHDARICVVHLALRPRGPKR